MGLPLLRHRTGVAVPAGGWKFSRREDEMNGEPTDEPDYESGGQRMCQGTAPGERPCNMDGTVHCVKCDGWFCDQHAEDEQWHACMREQR